MDTNFYVNNAAMPHIGKRSAAGLYCWDCRITLCKTGNDDIHSGSKHWFDKCPICSNTPDNDHLYQSAVGRELGFNTQFSYTIKKHGVKSCSSFTWALFPAYIRSDIAKVPFGVIDEYGQVYSSQEFDLVLAECPIYFFNMLGKEFC